MFPLYLFFIVISLFTGRKCVDMVVTFNKGREKTFAVSLQIHKRCDCIKYIGQQKIFFDLLPSTFKLKYIHVADSENHIDLTPLALVSEIWTEFENYELTNFSSFSQEIECYWEIGGLVRAPAF